MNIQLPDNVSMIITRLEKAGYEAYAVGGCVRDSLLGREPQDWDITTSALPEETKSLFSRTIDTGIQHGTVTVMIGKCGYEVTTYRIDGKYSDSRHPDSVSFTRSLEEDLLRRDFTINAMAYNNNGPVDLFGGAEDLERGIIRCVGVPEARFSEDALRILRAVRFSAQLGFDIDPATLQAAKALAPTLVNISAERIHAELHKLLLSPNPDRLEKLCELDIDRYIFPELRNVERSGKMDILTGQIANAPLNPSVRWAVLLLFTGSAMDIMHRLKFDNKTIYAVRSLIRLSNVPLSDIDARGMRRLINDAGTDMMEMLFDFRSTIEPDKDHSAARALFHEIEKSGDCTDIKGLAVNGRDLIEAGIPAGKNLGSTLEKLLDAVLDDPALNTKEQLLELVKKQE